MVPVRTDGGGDIRVMRGRREQRNGFQSQIDFYEKQLEVATKEMDAISVLHCRGAVTYYRSAHEEWWREMKLHTYK